MKYFGKILSNKYLLTAVAFVVWMLFFDRNDIPLQIRRMHELNKLQNSEKLMTERINKTRDELKGLKNSPATLEKYARERYLMKKPNEDLFIVEKVSGN